MVDWFDLAPALVFAAIAGLMAHFIGGTEWRNTLLGAIYIAFAGVVSAAAVAFLALDGALGWFATQVVAAPLVAPIWLLALSRDRTPVSEAEMDALISEAEALLTEDANRLNHDYDLLDWSDVVREHIHHVLWRLPDDAPRRSQMKALENKVAAWLANAGPPRVDAETRG